MAGFFDDEEDSGSFWDASDFFDDDSSDWERRGALLVNKKTGETKPVELDGGELAITKQEDSPSEFRAADTVLSYSPGGLVIKGMEAANLAPKDLSKLMVARGLDGAAGLVFGIPQTLNRFAPIGIPGPLQNALPSGVREYADDIRPNMLDEVDRKTEEVAMGADNLAKEYAFTAGGLTADLLPGMAVGMATGAGPLANSVKSPLLRSLAKAGIAAGEGAIMGQLAMAGTGQEDRASLMGAGLAFGGAVAGEAAARPWRKPAAAPPGVPPKSDYVPGMGVQDDIASIVAGSDAKLAAEKAAYESGAGAPKFVDSGLGMDMPDRINQAMEDMRLGIEAPENRSPGGMPGSTVRAFERNAMSESAADNAFVDQLAKQLGADSETVINKIKLEDTGDPDMQRFEYPIQNSEGRDVGYIKGSISTHNDGVRTLQVTATDIDAAAKGQKLGVKGFIELLQFARENDLRFQSDANLSDDAVRVYEGLERRGHSVTKNEGAVYDSEYGITSAPGAVFTAEFKGVPDGYRRGSVKERARMVRVLDAEIAKVKSQARAKGLTPKEREALYAKARSIEEDKANYQKFDALEEERHASPMESEVRPADYESLDIDLDGENAGYDIPTALKYGLDQPGVVGKWNVAVNPDGPISVEAGLDNPRTTEGMALATEGRVDIPTDSSPMRRTVLAPDPARLSTVVESLDPNAADRARARVANRPIGSLEGNVKRTIDLKAGTEFVEERFPGPLMENERMTSKRTQMFDFKTQEEIVAEAVAKRKEAARGRARTPETQTRPLAAIRDRTFETKTAMRLRKMGQWFQDKFTSASSTAELGTHDAGSVYDEASKRRIINKVVPYLKEEAVQLVEGYRATQDPVTRALDANFRAQSKRTGEPVASIKSRAYRDGVNLGDYSNLDPPLVEALKIGQKNITDFSNELRKRGLPEKLVKAFAHEEGFHLRRDYMAFHSNDWMGHLRRAARSKDPVAARMAASYEEAISIYARDFMDINPDLTPEQAQSRAKEAFDIMVSKGDGDWQHAKSLAFKRANDTSLQSRVQEASTESDFITFFDRWERIARKRAEKAGLDPSTPIDLDPMAVFESFLSRQKDQKVAGRLRSNLKTLIAEHMDNSGSYKTEDGKYRFRSKTGEEVPVKRVIHAALQEEDLPRVLREALGEIEDPTLQQQRTIAGMAHDIAWYDFWSKTMKHLEENGMSSKVYSDQFSQNIGQHTLSKKVGDVGDVYVPREVKAMFDAIDDVHNNTSKAMAIANAIKYGKVMNPGTWFRNIFTVPIMTTMAGDTAWMGARAVYGGAEFLLSGGREAGQLKSIVRDVKNVFGAAGHEVFSGRTVKERALLDKVGGLKDRVFLNRAANETLARLNLDAAKPRDVFNFFIEAKKLGLLEGGSTRELLNVVDEMDARVREEVTNSEGQVIKVKPGVVPELEGNIKLAKRVASLLYKSSDTVAMMTGYVNRLQQLAWAESGEHMGSSVPVTWELKQAAADSVKNGYQYFRRTPQFFKDVSRRPISSSFITFPAEMARNMVNNSLETVEYVKRAHAAGQAGQDIKAAKYGILAANKAMGVVAGTMLIRTAAGIAMKAAGWGYDQLNAFRESAMNKRSQDSPPIVLSVEKRKDGKTEVRYLDGNTYNPYADVDKMAWILSSPKPGLDKAKEIAWYAMTRYAAPVGIAAKAGLELGGNAFDEQTWDTSYRYVDNPASPSMLPEVFGDDGGKKAYRLVRNLNATAINKMENAARSVGAFGLSKTVGKKTYNPEDELWSNAGIAVQTQVIEDGLTRNYIEFSEKTDRMFGNAQFKLKNIPRSDMASRKKIMDFYEGEWKKEYGLMLSHVRNSKIMGLQNNKTYDLLDKARVGNEDFKWELTMGKPKTFAQWFRDKVEAQREREEE